MKDDAADQSATWEWLYAAWGKAWPHYARAREDMQRSLRHFYDWPPRARRDLAIALSNLRWWARGKNPKKFLKRILERVGVKKPKRGM